MVTALLSGGPAFRMTARQCLDALGPTAVAAVAAEVAAQFGDHTPISTIFTGERPDVALPQDLGADLDALAEVLPPAALSREQLLRDRFSTEPRFLAYLRQLEGQPAQPLAVLCPHGEDAAEEAMTEARAMGFTLAPGARQVALMPPPFVEVEDAEEGSVRFSASAGWDDLAAHAGRAGLCTFEPLRRYFQSPLDAASAGVFGPVRPVQRFGRTWSVRVTLPPSTVGLEGRSFLFSDAGVAQAVLQTVVRSYAPLFAETRPWLDVTTASAAALLPRLRQRHAVDKTALLTVVSAAPDPVRKATLKAMSQHVRAAGGRPFGRVVGPDREAHDAVIAAAGIGRLERPAKTALALPEGAIALPRREAVQGRLTPHQVLWYIRDLARSCAEAQAALGLIEDVERPVAEDDRVEGLDLEAHG